MDAFLLHALLPELADLGDGTVRSVDLTDPRTLQLGLYRDKSTRHLALSCDPNFPRIEILDEPDAGLELGPFLNTVRAYLLGSILKEVRQLDFDRIILLIFDRKRPFGTPERLTLMLRLFGRGANLYLETDDGTLASLRPGRIPKVSARTAEGGEGDHPRVNPLTVSPEKLRAIFKTRAESNLQSALVQGFTGISPFWAKEILIRADLDPASILGSLKDWQTDLLWSHVTAWIEAIRAQDYHPHVYYDSEGEPERPVAVTPIPAKHLQHLASREFSRVSEAVAAFYRAVIPAAREGMIRDQIQRRIREKLKRVERSLRRVEERRKNASREAEYRRFGELIISNLHSLKSGSDELTVVDHYDPSRPNLRIPADPAKSPRANAEAYFTKARKAQRSKKALAIEIGRLTGRKEDLEKAIESASAMGGSALLEYARRLGVLPRVGAEARTKKEQPAPFRTFTTSVGWTVWVGRNDRENDLLTHSRAASHDYWFHARGMAGSHVVLRRPDKTQRPSRKTIQEAAEIAAYYSKGRKSKTVDVTYTEKKYVRKPRKGKPGLALVTNEEVIFVKPRLPDTATGGQGDKATGREDPHP
jgi:predicted ribosome quality control (RQC) complex YloA/Tae2 family protein